MFTSLEEALHSAKAVSSAEPDGGEAIEERGVKFFVKSAKVESSEESFVGRDVHLSANGVNGALSIVFAVPPATPLYGHDKKFLAETHEKYSPKGTSVKDVDYYNVDGRLVVKTETVMPVMDIKMRQHQLLFDLNGKQVGITVCSPDKKFPSGDIIEEILHSLFLTEEEQPQQ